MPGAICCCLHCTCCVYIMLLELRYTLYVRIGQLSLLIYEPVMHGHLYPLQQNTFTTLISKYDENVNGK